MSEEKTPPEPTGQKEQEAAASAKEKVDRARAEVEKRLAEVKRGEPKPPPIPAIPDHLGALRNQPRPQPPTPPAPPMPRADADVITLGVVEGSELHIQQLGIQLILKEMDKATLRAQLGEAQKRAAELELQLYLKNLETEQKKTGEIMKKYSVPEGWNINRNEDGTYSISRPKPPAR